MSLKTYLKTKIFNFKQQFFVILKYYKNLKFCFIDLFLLSIYLFKNPYKISKKFLIKKNKKDIHIYGETPLTSFEKIIKRFKISKKDKILEMGSGRGRIAFFLSTFYRMPTLAVEWIPFFYKTSIFLKKIFFLKNIHFLNKNMLLISKEILKDIDFIYLYGTCLEKKEIFQFLETCKSLSGLKIITISYPLKDYDSTYSSVDSFDIVFPFGKTTCFLNKKKIKNLSKPFYFLV